MTDNRPRFTADTVAIILAVGVAVALNIVTIALLWAAWQRLGINVDSGISENGTQLLTGWGGAMIGVLGSYLGYRYGEKKNGYTSDSDDAKEVDPMTGTSKQDKEQQDKEQQERERQEREQQQPNQPPAQ